MPAGEQGGEPTALEEPAGERRLLPGARRGGARAGLAEGAPGLLETIETEERDCVTRSLAGATACADWTYRAFERGCVTRGHRRDHRPADSEGAGSDGPKSERCWRNQFCVRGGCGGCRRASAGSTIGWCERATFGGLTRKRGRCIWCSSRWATSRG